MRDLFVTAVIFGSLPLIFRRPQIGVLMWVWISVMNPHRLAWGFAYNFNFAAVVAVATLASVLMSKELKRPPADSLFIGLVLFAAWTGVTTFFALHPEESFGRWTTLMKTMLMTALIPMLFHKKEDLRLLVWVIVLSIGFYGAKGGLWTLAGGGVGRVFGPPNSYVEDNNALAVAIIMVIPLMRYLQVTTTERIVRWSLTAAMLLCAVSVLGSHSRGALLAVSAMGIYLWWKGKNKLPVLLMLLVVIPVALQSMPEAWYDRMGTIKNFEDASAQSRLNSWRTMINLANARPLVGGGFEVSHPDVYARFAPGTHAAQAAHSIYFQALGEHGYVGLALYLFLLAGAWLKAGSIARSTLDRPDLAWAREFSMMLQVTLVGFAVGGAFISLVNFDVPYYLIAILIATATLVKRESRKVEQQAVTRPSLHHGSRANNGIVKPNA